MGRYAVRGVAGSALAIATLGLGVAAFPAATLAASGDVSFHIVGGGAPKLPMKLSNGSVLRLKNGAEIAAALVRTTPTGPPRLKIFRHAKGADHWTHHLAGSSPGFKQVAADLPIERTKITLVLSSNHKYVEVVVDGCRYGVVASTIVNVAPLSGGKLRRAFVSPEPYGCAASQQSEQSGKGYAGSALLPFGEFGQLMAVFNADAPSPVWGVSQAGFTFRVLKPLPELTGDNGDAVRVVARGITWDPSTSEVTVVGSSEDHNVYVWKTHIERDGNGDLQGDWSSPQLIYTAGSGDQADVASVTAYGGKVFVAIDQDTVNSSTLALDNTLGFVERGSDGTWSDFSKVPHSSAHDLWAIAEFNPYNGSLHATWTRGVTYGDSGTAAKFDIFHATLAHGSWSGAKVLVDHKLINDVTSLSLTSDGHPVVGYTVGG